MRNRGGDIPKNDAFRAEEWGLGQGKLRRQGPDLTWPHRPKWSPTLSNCVQTRG